MSVWTRIYTAYFNVLEEYMSQKHVYVYVVFSALRVALYFMLAKENYRGIAFGENSFSPCILTHIEFTKKNNRTLRMHEVCRSASMSMSIELVPTYPSTQLIYIFTIYILMVSNIILWLALYIECHMDHTYNRICDCNCVSVSASVYMTPSTW